MERTRDTMCFGCGRDNPVGLHLHFRTDEDGCYTSFVPQPVHQSYDGRMHGGLISTLLDETMGNYPYMYEHRVAYTDPGHYESETEERTAAGNDGTGGPGGRHHRCRSGREADV